MPDHFYFYLIFASQILLISFYFPRKMFNRIGYVLTTYPPAEFPKLYPQPIEYYERARHNYRNMNFYILLAGLVLLVGLLFYPRSGKWDGAIVNAYFILQFAPMLLLEIWTRKYYQRMRESDQSTTRKAELNPRRLFDFISPAIVGLAIIFYFAFIALILYIRQFDFPWFGGYWNIVGVTAGNLIFAGIIAWNLKGKKRDPYQAYEDRLKQMELVVKQMVFMSIAMTAHIAMVIVIASLDLRYLQPAVVSLYLQLMAVIGLRTLRIENMNFAVYKEQPLAALA